MKMMLLASFMALLIFSSECQAEDSLLLGTFAGPPLSTPEGTGFYDLVLTEAFNRSGYKITIIHLPAERSLANANEGITDGDFVRISGVGAVYPNLIQVPEKIADFEFVAFTKHIDTPITGWSSLEPYHIGIVRGWKILEKNIVGTRSLVRVRNQNLLFSLLENDRTDIVVYSKDEGYELIKKMGYSQISILEPPLAKREMFLYLNKKHSRMIPGLDANLKAMKRDGTFENIRNKTLSRYLTGLPR